MLETRSSWIVPAALVPLLVGCDAPLPVHELTGGAMGTSFSVKVVAPPDGLDTEALRRDVEATLAETEQSMSTYIPDSELSRFNASDETGWQPVSRTLCAAIDEAQAISTLTGGAFDVTVGPLVDLWGFGPGDQVTQPPAKDRIATVMAGVGNALLHADCSMPAVRKDVAGLRVDLSAFAKGLGVDRIAALLDGYGIDNYLVEIGGELRMRGTNARDENWSIAIETPVAAARSVHTILSLTDSAMATSGDYRNYFEHDGTFYSHTIDPRSGYPISHDAASVTVVADTTAMADALATALLVLGPGAGLELAARERIAAFFLLRIGDTIEERMSPVFATEIRRK